MTFSESTRATNASVKRVSLRHAFGNWYATGWLAYLVLPLIVFGLLSQVLPDAVAAVFVPLAGVWVVGWVVYPFFALWKVWQAERSAGSGPRWFTRVILLAVSFPFIVVMLTPSHGDGIFGRRLKQGAAMAAPARTAIDAACSEGTLEPDLSHDSLGLDAPSEYANRFARSVTVHVEAPSKATVTVALKEIRKPGPFGDRRAIPEGATVVYSATCAEGKTHWTIGGTVPEEHRPRI